MSLMQQQEIPCYKCNKSGGKVLMKSIPNGIICKVDHGNGEVCEWMRYTSFESMQVGLKKELDMPGDKTEQQKSKTSRNSKQQKSHNEPPLLICTCTGCPRHPGICGRKGIGRMEHHNTTAYISHRYEDFRIQGEIDDRCYSITDEQKKDIAKAWGVKSPVGRMVWKPYCNPNDEMIMCKKCGEYGSPGLYNEKGRVAYVCQHYGIKNEKGNNIKCFPIQIKSEKGRREFEKMFDSVFSKYLPGIYNGMPIGEARKLIKDTCKSG